MKLLTLLIVLFPVAVWSEEKVKPAPEGTLSIDSQNGPYWVDPRTFTLGYTIKTMRYGFPIGLTHGSTQQQSPATSVSEMTEQMVAATKKNAENLEKSKKTITSVQSQLGSDGGASPDEFSEQTPAAATEQGQFDLERCLADAQVLLKRKMNLDYVLSQSSLTGIELSNAQRVLDAVLAQLQKHRGAAGLPCAAGDVFLDGISVDSDKEKIQVLMALAARKETERLKLKRALAISKGTKYPTHVRATWTPIWKRLAMAAVFTTGPLPTYKSIVDEMKTENGSLKIEDSNGVAKVGVTLKRDVAALDANIEEGLKLLGSGNAND